MNTLHRYLFIATLIAIAILSRFVPHPPNFTAVGAIALFSGASLGDRRLAYLIPLVAMFISDCFIGFHGLMAVVYAASLVYVWIGIHVGDRISAGRIVGGSLLGCVAFFAISNLGCWWMAYEHSFAGLLTCYVAAIPFFGWNLVGDLTFSTALFGSLALAEMKMPQLRPAPAVSLGIH